MVNGRLDDRAEKGHKKVPSEGYVLTRNNLVITAGNWLKYWTSSRLCGIIIPVKNHRKGGAEMSQKPNKPSKSIAEYEHEISALKAEIDDHKLKLEHMNEILVNMQRARFGQSSEKQKYVSPDQLSVFNEAEMEQDPKAPEPDEKTIIVPEHGNRTTTTPLSKLKNS